MARTADYTRKAINNYRSKLILYKSDYQKAQRTEQQNQT